MDARPMYADNPQPAGGFPGLMEIDMYGFFIQTARGLQWVSNHPTLQEAEEIMADYEKDDVDFVLILPVYGFKDLDGTR